jgi:CRISPR-associated protein Csb2
MTTIQLTFPWGRYYAHPWGINPTRLREPEWPPSPWRLLRALVSAWFRAHPGQVPDAHCITLIESLGRELPEIGTGKVSFGHTVHWQPNYGAAGKEDKADASYKNTRHENHFAAVPGAVFFRWRTVELTPEQHRTLETLLSELSYFGRAESLCQAELYERELTSADIGWCQPAGGRKISASCRDVFCPIPGLGNFRFTDLWSRRSAELAPDSPDAPPHLVDTLLSSDMKADGAAWLSYQMPDGWPQKWVVRTPQTAHPGKKNNPPAGPKVAHYLRFSLQCRVPLLPKFTVRLSEEFRDAANRHLCKTHGNGTPSFALFGHAKDRPADAVGDHQHAFYLPMCGNSSGFLSDLHVWCPYGFTQAEIEVLLRVNRLDWGSRKYPVRPILTAMAKEPPADVPFSTGNTASRLWRSASPFVPPRYFYRGGSGKCLGCARDLHGRFGDLLKTYKSANGDMPTLSVGVAIGHFMENLEDLLDYGRAAEKSAKAVEDKDALAIHLHKRGGVPISVRAKWCDKPDTRLSRYASLLIAGAIPAKLPYDLRNLANLYQDWPAETAQPALRIDVLRIIRDKQPLSGRASMPEIESILQNITSADGVRQFALELLLARAIAGVTSPAANDQVQVKEPIS